MTTRLSWLIRKIAPRRLARALRENKYVPDSDSMIFGFGSKKERKEATRLGITVSEVTRDLPHFSRDGKTVTLEPGRCVQYSIPRRGRDLGTWALTQRTKALGATMPNDYLLTSCGPLSTALENLLQTVAAEYAEELFEFEGTSTDVVAYWEEWGGAEKVRSLHGHLDRLASW